MINPSTCVARAFAAHYLTTTPEIDFRLEVFENAVSLYYDDKQLVAARCYMEDGKPLVTVCKVCRPDSVDARMRSRQAFNALSNAEYFFEMA